MARWLSFEDFKRGEWAVVVAVSVLVVALNKAGLRDAGSSWATLLVLAFFAGVVVVNLLLWARIRRFTRSAQRSGLTEQQ